MTTPIGSASITVQAVTDAFERSLGSDTDRVLASLERNFERTWDNLRHAVDNNADLMVVSINQASREIRAEMQTTARSIEQSFDRAADRSADRLEASFQQAARDIAASFERASEQSTDRVDEALTEIRLEMQRTTLAIQQDADEAGDAIGSEISRGVLVANAALSLLRDGSDRALGSVAGLGSSLLGVGSRGASAFGSLSAAAVTASVSIAAFAQAAVGAIAVMEQLAGVVAVAPAAILSFVAVTKTLDIALKGVSKTIGASLSNDTATFAKEMGKLQPAAQQAITALDGVIESLKGVGGTIQQNFFEGLAEPLVRFGEAAEVVARKNLQPFATVLGDMAAALLDVATTSNLLPGVNAVLQQTVKGVAGLQGPLTRLAPAFGNLFLVGSGFIDRMYDSLGRLIDRFSTFVNESAQSGSMNQWIEDSLAGFRQLGRILENLGSVFTSITFNAGQAGVGILDTLERITEAIDEALGSDQGQAFMIASFGLLAQIMDSLAIVAGPLVELFAVFATIVATRLTSALESAEPFLRSVAEIIGNLSSALPGVNDRVNDVAQNGFSILTDRARDLLSALSPVVPLFETFRSNLSGIGDEFDGAFLDSLIESIGELGVGLSAGTLDALDSLVIAFAELGSELPNLLPIVGQLAQALGEVLGATVDALVPLIGPLVRTLEDLAPALDFVANALGGIAQISGGLLSALMPLVRATAQLASMIADSLNPAVTALRVTFAVMQPQLQRIGDVVGGALSRAFTGLKPGIDAIVEGFVELLPLIRQFLDPIEDLAVAVAPLIEIVGVLAGKLIAGLAPAIFRIIEAGLQMRLIVLEGLVPVLTALSNFLVEELGPAFDELLPVIIAFFNGIATAAEFGVSVFRPIFELFVDMLSVVLPAAFESAKTAITIAWDAIVLVVETAWDIIEGVFLVITRFLSGDFAGAWRALKDMIVDVFSGIWDFIVETVNNIIEFFSSDAVGRLASAVSGMFQAAWEKVSGWMTDIWNSVTDTTDDIIQWIKDLPAEILEAAGNANEWLFNIGKDIVNGLIEGLKDAAGGLKDIVNDFIIEPVKGFFSEAFDFGSPSKVTKQWGNWIGEGLAIGMTDAERQVVAAAEAITLAAALPGMNLNGSTFNDPTGTASFSPVASGGVPLTGGTGPLFGPGSIQVVFSGVVPTDSQAYATGQSIGSGIADELARRDARLAVGTL